MQRTSFGAANLDEHLFNTFDGVGPGTPYVLAKDGQFRPTEDCVSCGPGAFVAPAILERGFNAWFGAPGYYVDVPGVDRVIPDEYVHNMYPPELGVNPWDSMFGLLGSYGLDDGVGVRDWGDQAGRYSLS